jgi:hypothetical protein
MVALETGTNLPAVSVSSLLAILMTKLRQRVNGKGVPTQSQSQAACLTLSACNVPIQVKDASRKKFSKCNMHTCYCIKFLQKQNLIYECVKSPMYFVA